MIWAPLNGTRKIDTTWTKRLADDQVKRLINHIAMRGEMVIVLALHNFGIEMYQRFRNLDQSPSHFTNELFAYYLVPSWLFLFAQPPAIALHLLCRAHGEGSAAIITTRTCCRN